MNLTHKELANILAEHNAPMEWDWADVPTHIWSILDQLVRAQSFLRINSKERAEALHRCEMNRDQSKMGGTVDRDQAMQHLERGGLVSEFDTTYLYKMGASGLLEMKHNGWIKTEYQLLPHGTYELLPGEISPKPPKPVVEYDDTTVSALPGSGIFALVMLLCFAAFCVFSYPSCEEDRKKRLKIYAYEKCLRHHAVSSCGKSPDPAETWNKCIEHHTPEECAPAPY